MGIKTFDLSIEIIACLDLDGDERSALLLDNSNILLMFDACTSERTAVADAKFVSFTSGNVVDDGGLAR